MTEQSDNTISSPVLGVLGCGQLASYTIAAMRKSGHSGEILLSPRNAETAARLAGRFGCHVMADNPSVVANADIIMLAVRPLSVTEVLREIVLEKDQILMSAVGGLSIAEIAKHSQGATVVRIMPSSFIEYSDPFIPVYPANQQVSRLFGVGCPVLEFESESAFDDSMIASCSFVWTYGLLQSIESWFVERGWSQELSREMALRHMQGAVDVAGQRSGRSFQSLFDEIATKGTFTRGGYDALQAAGGHDAWIAALEWVSSAKSEA